MGKMALYDQLRRATIDVLHDLHLDQSLDPSDMKTVMVFYDELEDEYGSSDPQDLIDIARMTAAIAARVRANYGT